MDKLIGLPAAPGIAMGPAFVYRRKVLQAKQYLVDDTDQEFAKLESALTQAEADLGALMHRAREQVGEEEAAIFEAQAAMLRDPELQDAMTLFLPYPMEHHPLFWMLPNPFFQYAGDLINARPHVGIEIASVLQLDFRFSVRRKSIVRQSQ